MKYILISILFISLSIVCFGKITPTKLTSEYLQNPSVVDVAQPRLEWVNIAEKGERGQSQTAYQIRVATSKNELEKPNLWDSN